MRPVNCRLSMFDLDGPDRLNSYWEVSTSVKINLVIVSNTMDSHVYVRILYEQSLEYCCPLGGNNFIFQQDGASCHASNLTKYCLQNRKSKFLNGQQTHQAVAHITVDVWRILAKNVYANPHWHYSQSVFPWNGAIFPQNT